MRGGLSTLGVDENVRRRELVGVVMRMALVVGSRGGIAGAIVSLCLKLGSISREDFWELAFGCKWLLLVRGAVGGNCSVWTA